MQTPAQIARRAQRQRSQLAEQQRARFSRTNADFLVNEPDGFPSAFPPVHWIGLDSGSGAIGPNGPWSSGGGIGGGGVFGSGWDYLHGVGEAAALPIVIRATSLITGPLTSSPFRQTELATGRTLTPGRWVSDPMLVRPDARIPGITALGAEPGAGAQAWPAVLRLARSIFWTDWIRSAIWHGIGVILTQRYTQPSDFDDAGNRISRPSGVPIPGTMKLLHPWMVDPVRKDDGLHWAISPNTDTELAADRDGWLDVGGLEYQLVVLRNPHSPIDEDGRSLGVFDLTPQAFRLERQLETYASGTFRSGVPAGYLKVNQNGLTQKAADDLKASWLRAHGGDRRSIAVLNAVTDFTPLSISPVDAALADVKRLAIADVAFAFGLDPITLGAPISGSGTYTNTQDAWENHRDFGLALWIAAVEDTLTALTPGTQGVEVNMAAFGNPTLKEQYEAAATAVNAGLITADEWRADRGLPPLETAEPVAQVQPDTAAADVVGLLPTGRHLRPITRRELKGESTDDQIQDQADHQADFHTSTDSEAPQRAPRLGIRLPLKADLPDRHQGSGEERACESSADPHERHLPARRPGGQSQVGRRDPDGRADLRADEPARQAIEEA